MAELSPAAKAVMDAYHDAPVTGGPHGGDALGVAAALQAVADQVVPEHVNPVGDAHDDARHDQWMRIRLKLLAIAAELDNTPQPLLETTTWRHRMTNEQTDWRALCAELIQLDKEQPTEYSDWKKRWNAAVSRTRAALAQPEPEGPTDEELEDFALQNGGGYFNCDCQEEADMLTRKHVSNYRAILTRWGRPTIKPVPVAERPWEREGWCDAEGKCWFYWPEWVNDNGDVSTSEPHSWEFREPEAMEVYPFSLPHHALPVPGVEVG